ncbi:MAG TPA: MarR family transcriptional regulator [Gaiellaceae bacterium]
MSTQASIKLIPRTPAVEAYVRLLRAHSAITRRLNSKLVADHGLTLNDYEVLMHLFRAEGQRLRRVDLAEQVILTPSGITRLLEGLERCGLVERASCASDARVTYAQLTEQGEAKLHEASQTHVEDVHGLFGDRFSAKEITTLHELLERLPADGVDESECLE